MRIAITGADGLTGRYVQPLLADAGIDCVPLVAELTDPQAVEAEVAAASFDRLIHLAGEAFVASGDWRRFYEVNQLGTIALLDSVARHHPHARCILASSAQVYGVEASGHVDEDRPLDPNNHYALSKAAMELCAHASERSLDIVITRPFNYTGIGQQVRYVVPKIVDHFLRRAPVIELGALDVRRDFGDVRSVAEAYVGLALAEAPPPLVNISTGRDHSIRELIAIASELTAHRLEVEVNPDFLRARDVPLLVGDNHRLRAALPGWTPRPIEETLAWMLNEGAAGG
jgi:nucleoside-diphosphate-sugar epimerase